jgi:hypothetical protein
VRFVERFEADARQRAGLSHPLLCTVHGFGVSHGIPFLLVDEVDGIGLRQAIPRGGFSPHQVMSQVCEVLSFAVQQGVALAELRPEWVLLDRAGQVKLIDWGLARPLRRASSPLIAGTLGAWFREMLDAPAELTEADLTEPAVASPASLEPAEFPPAIPNESVSRRIVRTRRAEDYRFSLLAAVLVASLFIFPCALVIPLLIVGMLTLGCFLCYREIRVLANFSESLRDGQFDMRTMMAWMVACTIPCLFLRLAWRDSPPAMLAALALLGLMFGLIVVYLARELGGEFFETFRLSGREPVTLAQKFRMAESDARIEAWTKPPGEPATTQDKPRRPRF